MTLKTSEIRAMMPEPSDKTVKKTSWLRNQQGVASAQLKLKTLNDNPEVSWRKIFRYLMELILELRLIVFVYNYEQKNLPVPRAHERGWNGAEVHSRGV